MEKKEWIRLHLNLSPDDVDKLDDIAAYLGCELKPQHAVHSKHGWNRKEAIRLLIYGFWKNNIKEVDRGKL